MDARSDQEAALHAFRLLRERATRYALAGTGIAVIAVILGTLLVCQQVYDGITLENITRAHTENVAIWALDAMPFLFGLWGQIASMRMAQQAGSLVESGTGELRRELEEARYTARAKTDFFARMSHELRTPLNAIIGMSDLVADAEDAERRREQARVIHDSAESLLTLINDVLDMSRIEAGRMELDSVEFDLRDHLNGAASLLEPQAAGKGLRLISLVPRDAPRQVVGDPGRLRQVLINLLGNAIKFTEAGEIVLSLRSWNRLDDGYQLTIEVADTGVGIAEQDRERLFEPYQQAEGAQGKGTGLGLSITRELVRAMDGDITVDSERGKGSVFSFRIRVGLAAEGEPAAHGRPIELRGRRMLLADGDAGARETLAGQLRAMGIDVTEAGDGVDAMQQALRAAREERDFDVVLADMFLPHLSGEDLGRRLKARPETRESCIAIMTTAGARGDAKRMKEAGFAAYLRRPLPPEHLQELLQAILATRSMSDDQRQRKGLVTRFSVSSEPVRAAPVLVVDDSAVNREILQSQLDRMGLTVTQCASGEEALAALAQGRYGAVIVDQHLGDGSGDELIARLRAADDERADLPAIVLSAGLTNEERERCERAGASEILIRPIEQTELRAALAPHLEAQAPAPAEPGPAPEPEIETETETEPASAPGSAVADEPGSGTDTTAVTPTLARLFIEEGGGRVDAIRKAMASEPPALETVAQEAHGLKGASQHLPAAGLTEAAERLEHAARAGDREAAAAELEPVQRHWTELLQRLKGLAEREGH